MTPIANGFRSDDEDMICWELRVCVCVSSHVHVECTVL